MNFDPVIFGGIEIRESLFVPDDEANIRIRSDFAYITPEARERIDRWLSDTFGRHSVAYLIQKPIGRLHDVAIVSPNNFVKVVHFGRYPWS